MNDTAVISRRTLLKRRGWRADDYTGTAQELIACGLVRPDQLPGAPGRGKTMATYFAADGQPVPRGCELFEPTFAIKRKSSVRFEVSLEFGRAESEWRCSLLPRGSHSSLPLDLPAGSPGPDASPDWAPSGFALRSVRDYDFVFEATMDCLAAANVLEGQALPTQTIEQGKCARVYTMRFGDVLIRQRTASTFFVILRTPRDIQYAAYERKETEHSVSHKGTKQQLQQRGLAVGIGFPGEPDCNRRKVNLAGQDGYVVVLAKYQWCADVPRYEVVIRRSAEEVATAQKAAADAQAEKLRLERLNAMAPTQEKFREDIAGAFWCAVERTKALMLPQEGYRFAQDAIDEFIESVSEAYWVLKEGETVGVSPRRKLQQVLGERAKANAPLQRFLANLDRAASE